MGVRNKRCLELEDSGLQRPKGILNNGKENGNHYSILRLYRGNGKENGNCYDVLLRV